MRSTKTTTFARLDYRLTASGPNAGWTHGPKYDDSESAAKIADAVARLDEQRGSMEYQYRVVTVTETIETCEVEYNAIRDAVHEVR